MIGLGSDNYRKQLRLSNRYTISSKDSHVLCCLSLGGPSLHHILECALCQELLPLNLDVKRLRYIRNSKVDHLADAEYKMFKDNYKEKSQRKNVPMDRCEITLVVTEPSVETVWSSLLNPILVGSSR